MDTFVIKQFPILIYFLMLISLILTFILYWIFKNPYEYPYKIIEIDISRRRNVYAMDEVDKYLCNHSINIFKDHFNYVQHWKDEIEEKINGSLLKSLRRKQFLKIVDDEHMFVFSLIREQTRYRQINYVKTSYKVNVESNKIGFSLDQILDRYNFLSKIDFQCTLREWYSKKQRKLMTKELKDQIKKRDNYTCQICGKYMPDEVGLHIDHIIPISKGGKSVPSNLRVLCSKCNGKKSNKLDNQF